MLLAIAVTIGSVVSVHGVLRQEEATRDVTARGASSRPHLTDNGLLVSTRSRLRVCVELSPSLVAEADAITHDVATGLRAVRRHPDWRPAGLGSTDVQPERGCPGATLPSGPVGRHQMLGPGETDSPSPYRTAVLVIDDAAAPDVLTDGRRVIAMYEVLCDRRADREVAHFCPTVSTALVLRRSDLRSPDLVPDLTEAVGLNPNRLG